MVVYSWGSFCVCASQWETTLLFCNVVSHWLDAYLKWSLPTVSVTHVAKDSFTAFSFYWKCVFLRFSYWNLDQHTIFIKFDEFWSTNCCWYRPNTWFQRDDDKYRQSDTGWSALIWWYIFSFLMLYTDANLVQLHIKLRNTMDKFKQKVTTSTKISVLYDAICLICWIMYEQFSS